MSIDRSTIHKLGHLAKIRLDDDQADALVPDLQNILQFVAQLNTLELPDSPSINDATLANMNLVDDQVSAGNCASLVIKNAPDALYDMFAVPKVVE